MTRKSDREPAGTFDADWEELAREGQAPELGGRSAEQARRDRERKRKMTPSERRRRARRVGLTLSPNLVTALRRICKEHGHVDDQGEGIISSEVVERFLWLAVEAYDQGMVEQYEEEVVLTREAFRWKSAAGEG